VTSINRSPQQQQALESLLMEHQERFWALKLKNDAVELEVGAAC
jgi:hypothetical protein